MQAPPVEQMLRIEHFFHVCHHRRVVIDGFIDRFDFAGALRSKVRIDYTRAGADDHTGTLSFSTIAGMSVNLAEMASTRPSGFAARKRGVNSRISSHTDSSQTQASGSSRA